jgi:hypothetical protein
VLCYDWENQDAQENPMKPTAPFPLLAALCALSLFAGGAAAQVSWTTTKTTNATKDVGSVQLSEGKLRVKVFPAYLDVEEEVNILAEGTVRPQNDAATLEIVGTFSLPAGSVITGALLWDGPRILQAKLLDKVKADSLYEDLVDRDSVPPPRPIDPLILERVSANTYKVKVYPVALGAARRFRIRYQISPRLGAEGFEMRLQGALTPLFGSVATISTTLEPQPGASTIFYHEGGVKREMTLPRTLFVPRGSLASNANATAAVRILPINPRRQVQVKTSFGTGAFKGHYLNLYGGVDESTLAGLGRIEVVVFWKWHNPVYWKNESEHVYEAGQQAAGLLSLYGALGLPGNRIGLLHDNSVNAQKAFPVAARGDTNYIRAQAYLESLQGEAVQRFVDSLAQVGGGSGPPPIQQSRSRFLANMQIVKTLYSPEEGVTRHLILVSAGPEYGTTDVTANAKFDSMFADRPVSVGSLSTRDFKQAGLNFVSLRQARPIKGATATAAQTTVPAFPSVTLFATVRNAAKAYDFSVPCTGGLTLTCGNLQFHGKATTPWSDTVEWEAYKSDGQLLGRSKTRPFVIGADNDTATVLTWAGSSSPFSEVKESALGPAYGFVDASASLLALEKDSLSASQGTAYADTGVPRTGPMAYPLPNPQNPGNPSGIQGLADDAKTWRFERASAGLMTIRVPRLAAGAKVEIELVGLDGKRVGLWSVTAEAGLLRWNVSGVRSGTYLLRLRGPNLRGERLLTL